ncbi:oligoendopeptidase F [Lujinxingia litoralis]|uniref:Oligopeptidase F n=1 Tax=Lujinxingia litoralis TaxID=2211119 RepID=A0A328C1S2_9DELT|nr:oligoendopeptidase F [Lujinxingia litoralis]RAL20373.1 oligoendopeptidase F [Lujinxingia litoralis]
MIDLSFPTYFDDDVEGARPRTRDRAQIDARYKWDLNDIYGDWSAWEADMRTIREEMDRFVELRGQLAQGAEKVLQAYRLQDTIGMISYKLYRYPQLQYDLDQRDNEVQARLQEVQQLFAEYGSRAAWFTPELLEIEQSTMEQWLEEEAELSPYRFPILEAYRAQEHVLDEGGEKILALGSRFRSAPAEIYRSLTTADVSFNTVTLSDGDEVVVSYGEYSNLLHTRRDQDDRRKAFEAMYSIFEAKRNTFASLYNSICQRDWAQAQSRNYSSTAEAALDDDNVPVSVLETLIEAAREGAEPLRRYHRLRKEVLGLKEYHLYDGSIPLLESDEVYTYDGAREVLIESVAPLGERYQELLGEALGGGWIDVYETEGKRSGAYSAGVYGVHPYMLLNYTDTLDDVFTLTHELGHTLHTVLSCEAQPFATSSYTIFVAEVASTTNEALLLDHLLKQTEDPARRAFLLQQAISGIAGTFYSQALFADYELEAHRMAERGEPMTAERLDALYMEKMKAYYGDALTIDELYKVTWARIPHFFNSPYYVYQYATCYASSAKIVAGLLSEDQAERQATQARYLELLSSGGNDHPMNQLQKAGVDLRDADTVRAVTRRMDELVGMLEAELQRLS